MVISGERARAYFTRIGLHRRAQACAHLAKAFDEARQVAQGHARHILPHQYLAIAASARANTYNGYSEGLGYALGQGCGHAFKHQGKGSGVLKGTGVVQ